jgi:hypothetical protein
VDRNIPQDLKDSIWLINNNPGRISPGRQLFLTGLWKSCPLSDRKMKNALRQGRTCFSLRFFERPSTLGIAASTVGSRCKSLVP